MGFHPTIRDLLARGSFQEVLHEPAAAFQQFGRRVFVRGVLEVSTFCRENFAPCGMRRVYLLYKRERFIMAEARVLAAIAAEGLEPSVQSLADFLEQNAPPVMIGGTT